MQVPADVPLQPLRYWPAGQDDEQAVQVPADVPLQPLRYCPAVQVVGQAVHDLQAPLVMYHPAAQVDVVILAHAQLDALEQDPAGQR